MRISRIISFCCVRLAINLDFCVSQKANKHKNHTLSEELSGVQSNIRKEIQYCLRYTVVVVICHLVNTLAIERLNKRTLEIRTTAYFEGGDTGFGLRVPIRCYQRIKVHFLGVRL